MSSIFVRAVSWCNGRHRIMSPHSPTLYDIPSTLNYQHRHRRWGWHSPHQRAVIITDLKGVDYRDPASKIRPAALQYCGLMSPCFCTKGGQCQPTTLCHLLHYNMLYNRWAAMSLHYSISVTHFTTNRAQLQHIHHHVGIHHTVRMAQRHYKVFICGEAMWWRAHPKTWLAANKELINQNSTISSSD